MKGLSAQSIAVLRGGFVAVAVGLLLIGLAFGLLVAWMQARVGTAR